MYIRKYMLERKKLTTVDLEESIESALEKIKEGDFLSLPVLDGEEFKGIIMKEAIYRKYFELGCTEREKYLKETKVKDLYSDEYKSIQEGELVENASYLLKELRTPFLPVFDLNNKFTGILTHVAIFDAFAEVFGIGRGTRIVVTVYDIPGQLARLLEVIKKENINVLNFATVDAKVIDVFKVVVRVDTKDEKQVEDLIKSIEKSGFKVGDVDE